MHPSDRAALEQALEQLIDDGTSEVGVRVGEDPAVRHLSLRGRTLERDASRRIPRVPSACCST